MTSQPPSSEDLLGPSNQPRFTGAEQYRDLAPAAETLPPEPQVIAHYQLHSDIPSDGEEYVAGILAQSAVSPNSPQVTLDFAEAHTNKHHALAQKLWGDKLAVGKQQVDLAGHTFEMMARYNINREGMYLQIGIEGDTDNEPTRSFIRQLTSTVGLYLLAHPRNSGARQSSPHVSVNLLETGKPLTPIQPYTRRQLEMLGETQQEAA